MSSKKRQWCLIAQSVTHCLGASNKMLVRDMQVRGRDTNSLKRNLVKLSFFYKTYAELRWTTLTTLTSQAKRDLKRFSMCAFGKRTER